MLDPDRGGRADRQARVAVACRKLPILVIQEETWVEPAESVELLTLGEHHGGRKPVRVPAGTPGAAGELLGPKQPERLADVGEEPVALGSKPISAGLLRASQDRK